MKPPTSVLLDCLDGMTFEELARERPYVYVAGAMLTYAQAFELARVVDAELLEQLVAGGAGFGGTFEQREAAVALTRACKAFVDAAKTARERGVL